MSHHQNDVRHLQASNTNVQAQQHTRASTTMHHSSNSRFILFGDNSRIIFSYCPYLSPKNITLLINKVSIRIIKIDKYMVYQFIFIKL